MNIQQPKVDLKNNFELYLEGVKVDFLSITISEMEGGIPAASIAFPSSNGVLRILPGTIVQIFGYYYLENTSYLMFEGEVTGFNFQRSEMGRNVVLKAISLLGSMIKAKFRPSDAILSKELKDNTGIQGSRTIIYNPDVSQSPTPLEDMEKIETKKANFKTGRVKDLSIGSLYGLTDEFSRMLAPDQPGGKGDFLPMLQSFNINFENNDLFYGLRSLAYKFGRTIFASPNPELLNKIKVDLFYESLNAVQSGVGDIYSERPYTLMQVLTEFQRYLHYTFITPANYTSCVPFYASAKKTAQEPLRMIYMPAIESAPPAMCNIFFPEQINSFTYSREMMDEPTRVVGKATISMLNGTKQPIDWTPNFVYPYLEFDTEKAVGNFTFEETYRGINYKIMTYENLQSDMLTKNKTKTGNGIKTTTGGEFTQSDAEGDLGRIIRPYIYMDWISMRYQGRMTSITSEWSPYRMIGMPALMLDEGVSIMGIISTIETTISALGDATMRVTLRNSRIIHDTEFETSEFSTNETKTAAGFEKYIIHDLTYDGMMSTHELMYYPDLYDFTNIGKDVYTYILFGQLSKNKGFYKLNEKGVFLDYKDKLNTDNFEMPASERLDNSILHYIINTDGSLKITPPENYTTKLELFNTYLLYKSVVALRKDYESKKHRIKNNEKLYDMPQVYAYIHSVNKRNIITKQDYFNFIGGKIARKIETDDAHDAKVIFSDGAQALRQELSLLTNEQYSTIVTSEVADTTNLRLKLKSLKAKYNQDSDNGKIKTQTDMENAVRKLYISILPARLTEIAQEKLEQLNKDLAEIAELEQQLTTIEQQTPEQTAGTITKNTEMYKPYNMTRRMHVRLAFKDTNDVLINNTKSNLILVT